MPARLTQPEPFRQQTGENRDNQEPRTKNQELKRLIATLALGIGLFSANGAHAALTLTLGGNGVYDSDLNVTWLANANLAATNTFGVSGINANGTMNWNTAQSWIGAMNTANYLGFNDWRLPTTLQPDASCNGVSCAYNCTGSVMGHLFYNELGGIAGSSILTSSDPDLALFQNIRNEYWSGTEYAPSSYYAWLFRMDYGNRTAYSKGYYMYAWAVRSGGQVAAVPAVPEPETYAMLLAGLGLLGFMARRRKRGA